MHRLKDKAVILLILIIVCGSCGTLFKKDHSLTVEQYKKLGMPDINQVWTRANYLKAFSVLSSVKLYKPLSLPKKESRKSGRVFENIINKANLSFTGDTTIPLAARAMEVQFLPGYLNNLTGLYQDKYKQEQYYSEELIDINIFGLYVYKTMLDLAGKIAESGDPDVASLKAGSQTVVMGYETLLARIMEDQVKLKVYSGRDLSRLSAEVSGSLIYNRRWFETDQKQKIRSLIETVIEKPVSDAVNNNYRNALEALKN